MGTSGSVNLAECLREELGLLTERIQKIQEVNSSVLLSERLLGKMTYYPKDLFFLIQVTCLYGCFQRLGRERWLERLFNFTMKQTRGYPRDQNRKAKKLLKLNCCTGKGCRLRT